MPENGKVQLRHGLRARVLEGARRLGWLDESRGHNRVLLTNSVAVRVAYHQGRRQYNDSRATESLMIANRAAGL